MDGRTYYFDKGDLKDNYGSTKYYEIRRCKKDADSVGRETRIENLTGVDQVAAQRFKSPATTTTLGKVGLLMAGTWLQERGQV